MCTKRGVWEEIVSATLKGVSGCNFFYINSFVTDVDECAALPGPCSDNAICINTDGSFLCECRPGFTGNGFQCEGERRKTISDKRTHFQNVVNKVFLILYAEAM